MDLRVLMLMIWTITYSMKVLHQIHFIHLRVGLCVNVLNIPNSDVLLTVHLSIFISVFNQLDAQNFVSQ